MESNIVINIGLGLIVLALLLPRLVGLTLAARTRLRNVTRRCLGIERFEELTISELRGYRADVDRYTRDMPTRAQVIRIRQNSDEQADALRARNSRLNSLKREVEELGMLLRSYTEALGPMWTTAQGHRMPLRLLSTSHLRNILDGGFARDRAADFIRTELQRRDVDAGFRADEAAGMAAPTRQDYLTGRVTGDGKLMPPPLSIHPTTMARLYVLPQWAQEIVTSLSSRRLSRISRQNRDRLEVLPLWAQDLIADLLRRAK